MPYRKTRYNSRSSKKEPIPSGVWFVFVSGIAIAVRILASSLLSVILPITACLWVAFLAGGLTAQKPLPPTRSTEPDPRKQAAYTRWKNILAGLTPNKDWLQIWRVDWWMGLAIGLFAGMLDNNPITLPFGLLFSFMGCMGVSHWLDRRHDPRHPYTGVSIPAFWTKSSPAKRVVVATLTLIAIFACWTVWYLEYTTNILQIVAVPLLVMLLAITAADRKRQTATWRLLTEWELRFEEWVKPETSPLHKDWEHAYVSSATTAGEQDNPLTILRVRLSDGVEKVARGGSEAIRSQSSPDGYNFVQLLGAKQQGHDTFDPNVIRIVLAKDSTAIPDITSKGVDDKTASLVTDLAYARIADLFHRRAPITHCVDVSADDNQAAWLITFTIPPTDGEDMATMGLNWLANDPNPGSIIGLPIFRDLFDKFHLAADPSTPLSDAGNNAKYREPNHVTRRRSFQEYIDLSRRYKTEQEAWIAATDGKIPAPEPLYDNERTSEFEDGAWSITTLPEIIQQPYRLADYAIHDLHSISPGSGFVGLCLKKGNEATLVTTSGTAPTRIDQLKGSQIPVRSYAAALVVKAILQTLKGDKTVNVESCTQEGRGVAIWKAELRLGNGATVADVRRNAANIRANVGAETVWWDWHSASSVTLWMTDRPRLSLDELKSYQRRSTQKKLIQLSLTEAWGQAGVEDKAGMAPPVVGLSVMPHNHAVLKVRFQIPQGISMSSISGRLEKFLPTAGYQYGRILDQSSDMPADQWDMLISKTPPFPDRVDADWKSALEFDDRTFPLGVNDMGESVTWDVRSTPHLCVMGKSGTGKSSLMQVPVVEALRQGYQLIIIDPSKGANDFKLWGESRALAFVGQGQYRETEAVIAWVKDEMGRRVRFMAESGCQNIADLPEDQRPPRIILAFDEFNSYVTSPQRAVPNPTNDTKITNINAQINERARSVRQTCGDMAAIAVQGRTAGINMLLGAQRLSSTDFDNVPNGRAFYRTLGKIMLGKDTLSGVMNNLSEANRLQRSIQNGDGMPQGRGIYESSDSKLAAVQTWWSGGAEKLVDLLKDIPASEHIDYSRFMPAEVETYGELNKEEIEQMQTATTQQETYIDKSDLEDAEEVDW